MRIRTRSVAAAAILVLAACGAPSRPDPAVTADLAARADAVAATIDSGAGCAAVRQLEDLWLVAEAARDDGTLPGETADRLLSALREITDRTECSPNEADAETGDGTTTDTGASGGAVDPPGKAKGKKKGRGGDG